MTHLTHQGRTLDGVPGGGTTVYINGRGKPGFNSALLDGLVSRGLVAKTSEVGDMGKPTRTRMGFTNPPSAHVTVTYTAVTR